jgi:uncharacterized protein YlzI (FlbEa/FlbD family)
VQSKEMDDSLPLARLNSLQATVEFEPDLIIVLSSGGKKMVEENASITQRTVHCTSTN